MNRSRRMRLCALLLAGLGASAAHAQDLPAGADADQLRYERLLHANPFDPSALNNLGVVKAAQGQIHDARDLLERAARLAPDSAEIRGNLDQIGSWQRSAAADSVRAAGSSKLPPEPPPLWNVRPPSR